MNDWELINKLKLIMAIYRADNAKNVVYGGIKYTHSLYRYLLLAETSITKNTAQYDYFRNEIFNKFFDLTYGYSIPFDRKLIS